MFLGTPKITGLLFNCAMNCALPRLLENIDALVMLEQANNLPSADDAVYANYQYLKTIFMTHYGQSDHASCSWAFFSSFLKSHSFYAQEIMFAPVFRIFIGEMALQSEGYLEEDLWQIRDIQSQTPEMAELYAGINEENPTIGRYNLLEIKEASKLFYVPLAIGNAKLNVHVPNTETYTEEEGTSPDFIMPSWLPQSHRHHDFSMYLRDNHYELLPNAELDKPSAEYNQELRSLPRGLTRVHEMISSSDSAKQSCKGLAHLVLYVHDALEASLSPNNQRKKQIDYHTYKHTTTRYHGTADAGHARLLLTVATRAPYRAEFKAACANITQVLFALYQANKITQTECNELQREIRHLYRTPESHEQFLQAIERCEQRVGRKFIAYCMLAAGYAAKFCSLGYLGDTWIEQANQKLEQIQAVENFASEAEVFYKRT